jgi:hypothetical protein
VKHRESMTQTGQGLIDADQEHEIIVGSEIFNAWGMCEQE